jgi:RNA polymerase sigma-70 factor (ECF subfamily)
MLEFFLRSTDDVQRYVGRLTGGDVELTEDIVQETFIALLRHARGGRDVTMQVGWLMTAARCRYIDHLRSLHRDSARVERHLVREFFESPEPDFGAVSSDQARWMLARLPAQERLALALHTVDGYTVAEVAGLIGRSVEATTSLLARARRRLRFLLLEAPDVQ